MNGNASNLRYIHCCHILILMDNVASENCIIYYTYQTQWVSSYISASIKQKDAVHKTCKTRLNKSLHNLTFSNTRVLRSTSNLQRWRCQPQPWWWCSCTSHSWCISLLPPQWLHPRPAEHSYYFQVYVICISSFHMFCYWYWMQFNRSRIIKIGQSSQDTLWINGFSCK